MTEKNKYGFTLVELSIVMVMIGLLVGGIMVGQDMVTSARIRGTITQIQEYNAAVLAFTGKFKKLPGDFSKASNYLGSSATSGDGDGCIDHSTGICTDPTTYTEDILQVWNHLYLASMINFEYVFADRYTAGGGFPLTKLKKGAIIAYTKDDINYWKTSNSFNPSTGALLGTTFNPLMTPAEAFGFDGKLDDENSLSGEVRAIDHWDDTASATTCADTNGIYYITTDTNICSLRIRMSLN